MINAFIVGILSLFIWNKATKDIEEKTQLASWTKTLVYLALSIIVGIFYYKTYQVATVLNVVKIDGVRECRDSSGVLADTVNLIRINNKFESSNITFRELKKLKENWENKKYEECGGMYVEIKSPNKNGYNVITNPQYENMDFSEYRLNDLSQVYCVTAVSTGIPYLIPIYPSYEDSISCPISGGDAYLKLYLYDLKKHPEYCKMFGRIESPKGDFSHDGSERNVENGSLFSGLIAQNKINNNKSSKFEFSFASSFTNTIGFFTAADISQYIQGIQIETDCDVKNLEISYDLPIEIEQYDSCMVVGPRGFSLHGMYLKDMIKPLGDTSGEIGLSAFLVKMPTLANLQLIRSLILTTLITALISLFFCNLYYLIRKKALDVKEKYLKPISELRVKQFRNRMYIILAVFFLFILYLAQLVLADSPFHIAIQIADYIDWIVIGIVILLCIFFYYLFRKAYDIVKDKKK